MPHLSQADKDFLAIAQSQGIELEPQDLVKLHRHVFESNQKARERLANPSEPVLAYGRGFARFAFAAVGVAVGIGVAIATAGAGGVATLALLKGALFGAAIGFQLGSALFRRTPEEQESNPLFEFSGTGELITLGSPIPRVYANRTLNPDGGIYFTQPPTVYSRVFSADGVQYLRRIVLLSLGQLGLVNEPEMLLDQQARSLFGTSDIETSVNLSNDIALAPGNIEAYSQAVRVNANAFVGLDEQLQIGGAVPTDLEPILSEVNNISVGGGLDSGPPRVFEPYTLTKNGGVDGSWDAGARGSDLTLGSNLGDYVSLFFRAGQTDGNVAAGFSLANPDDDYQTIRVGVWLRDNSTYATIQSGVVGVTGSYDATTIFELRYYNAFPSNIVILLVNRVEVLREAIALGSTIISDFSLATDGAILNSIQAQEVNTTGFTEIKAGVGTRFLARNTEIEDIDIQRFYRSGASEFRIVAKGDDYIEIDTPLFLPGNAAITTMEGPATTTIFGIYRAAYRTTKAVTSIEVTMRLSLFARNSRGELIDHGMGWDITLEPDGGTEQSLGGLFARSKREDGIRRSFEIANLPLGRYTVRLSPLTGPDIVTALPLLSDRPTLTPHSTPVTINGNPIILNYSQGVTISVADARELIEQTANDKTQTSNEQGPTGSITHINEIVAPSAISRPAEIRYRGHSTGYSNALASDRLQTAPAEGWAIDEGSIIRQYLVFGSASNSSTSTQVDDVNAQHLDDGVQVGDRIRLLRKHSQRVITAVTNLSATCQAYSDTGVVSGDVVTVSATVFESIREGMPITGAGVPAGTFVQRKIAPNSIVMGDEWDRFRTPVGGALTFNTGPEPDAGDEYVIFSMGSSPYFPDVFVDRLINPVSGLGNFVDQDFFIHYESIIYSRRFCVDCQFFYEAIINGGTFEDWATQAAPSSLLFVTKINGQYALIPERDEPISGIFNANNVSEYSEPYVPWIEQQTNTMLMNFSDRLGQERQIKIVSPEAATIGEVSQTIDLAGVKREAQAIAVGKLALNSLRLQNRACSLTGDIHTLRVRQGQLIRTQHVITEYTEERSGVVLAVGEPQGHRTETSGAIASIKRTFPSATGGTVIVASRPHGLMDGATVVITDNAALNGTHVITVYDQLRFAVTVAGSAQNVGTIAHRREVFDQLITPSENIATVPTNFRISIGSQSGAQVDLVVENTSEGLLVKGLTEAIAVGQIFCLGQDAAFDRTWRVSSLEPDILNNQVRVNAVLWMNGLNEDNGLQVIRS